MTNRKINFYAYTYKSNIDLANVRNGLYVKFGDSTRDPYLRMSEQGGANEAETKIVIKTWMDIDTIERDYQIHKVLRNRGLQNKREFTGKGTEWFKLPVSSIEEAATYLDGVIDQVGGATTSLKKVKLRVLQERALAQAMDTIEQNYKKGKYTCNILANLCPRFGKTIWALMLFNAISEKYHNRIMVLPAYWLSVHSSFRDEVEEFKDFSDIVVVDNSDDDAEEQVNTALAEGRRVVITLSLCGELEAWKNKHSYLAKHDNNDIFIFSDEADFGSHTDNQIEKMRYLFSDNNK